MAIKPILFNDEMVRSILAGRKTQTRRPITRSSCSVLGAGNSPEFEDLYFDHVDGKFRTHVDRGESMFGCGEHCDYLHVPAKAWLDENKTGFDWVSYRVRPLIFPGDVLWVRECWTPDHAAFYPNFPLVYRADFGPDTFERNERREVYSPEQRDWYPFRWRPSIHMPRSVARIFLRVTEVRCHRLRGMTDVDAIAEGFESVNDFVLAWDSIYDAFKYGENPWVFAFAFERCEEPKEGGAV